jgi:cytochrome P450
MSDQPDNQGIDLLALQSSLAREPQPTYRALIDGSPVLRVDGIGVVACSHEAVDTILHNPEIFSSNFTSGLGDLKNRRPLIPLQKDPPEHRKYRKLLDPLFAPQRVQLLETPVATLVNELIDTFVDETEIDFSQQFSVPFPSQVFLSILGLPLDELPRFVEMKDGVIRPDQVVGEPRGNPATEAHQQATADSIYEYFEGVFAERASERRDDLVSLLLDAEVDGQRLTHEELLDISFVFLIAGLDTVSASLDCFFAYLARNDDARHQVVDRPDSIPSVIEELLRWETPVMATERVATASTEIGGCPVEKGDSVIAFIGAANLDDAGSPGAGEVDFDRDANRHLAFGGGIHRCLGSHLARLELRVALREWHRRLPEYRIKPGVELDFTPGIRSLDHFPMLLGAATA